MASLTGLPPRTRVLGVPIGILTEAEAAAIIVAAAAASRGSWTITANLDHLRRYRAETFSRRLIDEADLVVADGMPLVWASRLAGTPLPERVAGSSLIWRICELAAGQRVPVYLLGGNPGAADSAAAVFRRDCPDLKVAGTFCPPLGFDKDPEQVASISRRVVEAHPRIVLVGLGFPKQDVLIRELRRALPEAAFVGVGVSFSFVAGELAQAPAWAGAVGLEWHHRLVQEPRRLARRYLCEGLPFAVRLFGSAARYRLFPAAAKRRWGAVRASASS